MNRDLSPEEQAVLKKLWAQKCDHEDYCAFVTATQELELRKWNGRHPVEENTVSQKVPAGTTLKVVMISRFWDFGLTDDLDAIRGYHIRVPWEDASITDLRLKKEGKPPRKEGLADRYAILKKEKV